MGGGTRDKLPRGKLSHTRPCQAPRATAPSASSVRPIVAWRYVARLVVHDGARVECCDAFLDEDAQELPVNKRSLVLLWAFLVALPAPLEWAQYLAPAKQVAEHAEHAGDAVACPGDFALALRGPCDAQGPCSNPSHGHHGHRHESPARPCIVASTTRPTPTATIVETVPLGLVLVLRALVLPADEAPVPICLVRPAGRAPPASRVV
jgi:hypothetical protein